jgi:hypothetical protein
MDIPGFTTESLSIVHSMLFAEGQKNPLEGECGQKKKRETMQQPRTPAQEQADQARSQAMRGRTRQSSATRSEAAKKAAETRKRCKGGANTTNNATV